MENQDEIREKARELVKLAWPEIATGRAKPTLATVKSVLAPYLRTGLMDCLDDSWDDGRVKPFLVTAQFFDMARGKDAAEMIGETEPDEEIEGQTAVLEQVASWLEDLHADEELSEDASLEEIVKKRSSFRSMLSRGGGICTLRIKYEADGVPHLAQVRVRRAGDE